MDAYRSIARPFLFRLDAEAAHDTTLAWAARASASPALCGLAKRMYAPRESESVKVKAFGMHFRNPLGLAAGLDKNGVAIDLWAALGFGFVELGTVTPGEGQPGNEPPRLVRIVEDGAVVNRMGFNNHGAPALARRMEQRRTPIPCGANLGKAKVTPLEQAPDDYEATLRATWPFADYIVVNVSSPNTPGLRDLQAVDSLGPLLARVVAVNRDLASDVRGPRPVLLKIAPDLADDDVDAVADLAVDRGLDGIVATNTTLRHDLLSRAPGIAGGVSGVPLGPRALDLTRRLFRRLEGRMPIVGVGGVRNAEDAWTRIRAGATLVQVYTGLIYEGPAMIASIVEGLGDRVRKAGYASISEAVGADA